MVKDSSSKSVYNSATKFPLVSIITVCYNSVETIEKTVNSVLHQTYPNIEYIIVDGGSTDGTVDVISRYSDKITYWISEPDKGIYDAMNKGLLKATGKWVNFLNSGDWYCSNNVISKISPFLNDESDIVYGDVYFVQTNYMFICRCESIDNMKYRMINPHPATFVRREYHVSHLFDISYKSSGDYNFFYSAYYKDLCKFQYISFPIAFYNNTEGMSKDNILIRLLEDLRVRGNEHKWFLCLKAYLVYAKVISLQSIYSFFPKYANNRNIEKIKKTSGCEVYLLD